MFLSGTLWYTVSGLRRILLPVINIAEWFSLFISRSIFPLIMPTEECNVCTHWKRIIVFAMLLQGHLNGWQHDVCVGDFIEIYCLAYDWNQNEMRPHSFKPVRPNDFTQTKSNKHDHSLVTNAHIYYSSTILINFKPTRQCIYHIW